MFKKILDNITKSKGVAILLIVLAFLLLFDIIIRFSYTQLSGQQFNNWGTPLITLIGLFIIVRTLIINREQIRNHQSKQYFIQLSESIDNLVALFQKSTFDLPSEPVLKSNPSYLNGVDLLTEIIINMYVNTDFKNDIKAIKENQTSHMTSDYFQKRSYFTLAVYYEILKGSCPISS